MLKLRWVQLAGIIRYEALLQWRRRGVFVLSIILAAILILIQLAVGQMGRRLAAEFAAEGMEITGEVTRAQGTLGMTYYAWPVVLMLMILAVPAIVADTFPRDRQNQVSELLHSLPVGQDTLLSGKLLGGWAGLLGGLAGVMILSGCTGRLLIGPYSLVAVVRLWGMGILPLALFSSGMSMLLASSQPTRRRAAFVGAAFSAYCVAMLATTTGTVWDALCLARPSVFLSLPAEHNPLSLLSSLGMTSYPPFQVPLAIGLGALQVALAWLAVWVWMCWQEAR
ncbi:MAG: hypothetical protein JW934_08775 [Anaerolineae bacterium]|nr:hypothetical protein [Anaerolineae bacterium]